MKKPVVIIVILLFTLMGCNKKNSCTISGIVTNGVFDGESLYLVPLNNPSKERVDSTVISNGRFLFKLQSDSAEIYILRSRPVLRLKLQELLIVKEPGILLVNLGESSFVTGTALNDTLQRWKDYKMKSDSISYSLSLIQSNQDEMTRQQGLLSSDSLNIVVSEFHLNFVRNNKENVVGRMVTQLVGGSFTAEQKKELGIQ